MKGAHVPQEAKAQLGLRSDALANRQRIIESATEAFTRNGVNASLEDIAKRAGVGIGTLYRRFPTRAGLIAAVYEPAVEQWAVSVEEAMAHEDPMAGLRQVFTDLFDLQFSYRGFAAVMTMGFPMSPDFEATRMRGVAGMRKLTRKAKATGCLRSDYSTRDLLIFMLANAGIVDAGGDVAELSSRRLLAYLLRSIAVDDDGELPRAPALTEVVDAMRKFRGFPPA